MTQAPRVVSGCMIGVASQCPRGNRAGVHLSGANLTVIALRGIRMHFVNLSSVGLADLVVRADDPMRLAVVLRS